ncbi:MAG: nucleoside triphosphate pyrophosphohydrolase [Chloroflexota bacterium]
MLDRLVDDARRIWGLDPAAGLQVIAAERLVATPIEPSRPVFVVPQALLDGTAPDVGAVEAPIDGGAAATTTTIHPLPGRHGPGGRDPLAILARLYPADHGVGRFGAGETTIRALTPADLTVPLYLPPVAPELASAGPWSMAYIADRLRHPDGCPWDREQTHESLRKHLLEETYEVYDALERGATPALAEELGDLLLQVVLHAQLGAEAGVFDLADVQASIARKIVRRHPHVFGDAVAATAADVNRQWERIKAAERADALERVRTDDAAGVVAPRPTADPDPRVRIGSGVEPEPDAATGIGNGGGPRKQGAPDVDASYPSPKGALDGISRSMPALAASQEMQERAAALGYDWPTIEGVLDKVAEELAELARAGTHLDRREEFGDLLLVVVNVGRKLGIEAEGALRAANDKFRNRFRRVERMVAERGVAFRDLDFATLDALWDAAKAEERAATEELATAEERPTAEERAT